MRVPKESPLDRRASIRYPLTLELRYSVSGRREPRETRAGRLIDLSSSGLRFTGQGPLEPGQKLEVAINWPVLLDERVQLQLVATGVVAWSTGTEVAMQIQRHDYRTRSMGLKAASLEKPSSPSRH